MHVEPLEVPLPAAPTLRGQRWADDPRAPRQVLLLHEPGLDLDAWRDLPALLAADGYAALPFDLPGHGLSDDPWEPARLPALLRALLASPPLRDAQQRFLLAAGPSAGAALLAAATAGHPTRRAAPREDPAPLLDALVCFSPRLGPADLPRLGASRQPKLLLVGAADPVSLAAAQEVARACGGWTALSTFPVPEQGAALLTSDWSAQAREQTLLFLRHQRR